MVKSFDGGLDAIFHALADPTRREILAMLSVSELSIGEMVPAFPISFVAVSKHIKALERAGLVRREVRGRNHVCSLDPVALRTASRWLAAYERFWNERLVALEDVLEEMKSQERPH
ncbi:ArsR/SmtB family transcription factor [Aurantimonas endophytica]|nr:metalloregulator ArsR/SmtB family transcription factor [Aurantimonas endophytica]MCO6405482.1 metalloregulator ArsR/SmtB family transcription factor [Aurantimonas endophytica]